MLLVTSTPQEFQIILHNISQKLVWCVCNSISGVQTLCISSFSCFSCGLVSSSSQFYKIVSSVLLKPLVEDAFRCMFKMICILCLNLKGSILGGFWNISVASEWPQHGECIDEGQLAYFRWLTAGFLMYGCLLQKYASLCHTCGCILLAPTQEI